ncbi:S-adenosylmethionine:tRNA ribosyltransferase-isomerase, partial [Kibdelosporangium lantanae]
VDLPSGHLVLRAEHVPRLWRATVSVDVPTMLASHGRPIRYAYVPQDWPIADYQTVFANNPGSAEMPSAGRPFTASLVTTLVSAGIAVAPITLHTGVSSIEEGKPPLPERFHVPSATANLVNLTRASGGRVIAVDTGPEAVAGSTRMKAGTAQKLVLTAFSTAVMVKLGRTYSNLMVSMRATNAKLRGRTLRILREATGLGTQECSDALNAAGG